MSASKFTRKQCSCPLFGKPKDLKTNVLPTYKDITRYCGFLRWQIGKKSQSNKEPEFIHIANIVAKKVINLYEILLIPTISLQQVISLIRSDHDKYIKMKNYQSKVKNKPVLKKYITDYKLKSLRLFDVAACKCRDFESCKCVHNLKVPEKAQKFLLDQRGERQLKLGSFDLHEDSDPMNIELSESISSLNLEENGSLKSTFPSSGEYTYNSSEEYFIPSSAVTLKSTQKVTYRNTVLTAQRYGVSDRATAAIASSVLADHGLVSEEDSSLVVDRNKLIREKGKINKQLQKKINDNKVPTYAIYFDGRKDQTNVTVQKGMKFRNVTIVEEHISVLSEPGSNYLGHVTPESGRADDISEAVFNLILTNGDIDKIEALGCDGTSTNTGYKGGAIRCFEKKLNRSVQWIVCLIHFNELPFRALFQYVDGETDGPNSFKGSIGKQLKLCEKNPIVPFEAIDCVIPDIDPKILSTDQKYLLNISNAIRFGHCPVDLSFAQPGSLNHARWLTCANRILRLYVSTLSPTSELKLIVNYLLKVYVPQWFSIRKKKSLDYGSKHLFEAIRLTRYLPEEYLKIVNRSISINAFFAFPENIILSMMTDERLTVRQNALEKILCARRTLGSNDILKKPCKLPSINFSAEEYYDMVDWQRTPYISPPVLRNISDETLEIKLLSVENQNWEFCKYPCHTVAVERMVQLVTRASSTVCGMKNREDYIRATLESRKAMPQFESKKDFSIIYE